MALYQPYTVKTGRESSVDSKSTVHSTASTISYGECASPPKRAQMIDGVSPQGSIDGSPLTIVGDHAWADVPFRSVKVSPPPPALQTPSPKSVKNHNLKRN